MLNNKLSQLSRGCASDGGCWGMESSRMLCSTRCGDALTQSSDLRIRCGEELLLLKQMREVERVRRRGAPRCLLILEDQKDVPQRIVDRARRRSPVLPLPAPLRPSTTTRRPRTRRPRTRAGGIASRQRRLLAGPPGEVEDQPDASFGLREQPQPGRAERPAAQHGCGLVVVGARYESSDRLPFARVARTPRCALNDGKRPRNGPGNVGRKCGHDGSVCRPGRRSPASR